MRYFNENLFHMDALMSGKPNRGNFIGIRILLCDDARETRKVYRGNNIYWPLIKRDLNMGLYADLSCAWLYIFWLNIRLLLTYNLQPQKELAGKEKKAYRRNEKKREKKRVSECIHKKKREILCVLEREREKEWSNIEREIGIEGESMCMCMSVWGEREWEKYVCVCVRGERAR